MVDPSRNLIPQLESLAIQLDDKRQRACSLDFTTITA